MNNKIFIQKNSFIFSIFLIVLVSLPSILLSFHIVAKSYAFGLLIFSLIITLFSIFYIKKLEYNIKVIKIFISILLFLILHSITLQFIYSDLNIFRNIGSIIILAILIIGSFFFYNMAKSLDDKDFDISIKLTFYFLVLNGILATFNIRIIPDTNICKPVFFFGEPSHYGLILFPFLFYVLSISNERNKIIITILIFLLTLRLENATMLIGLIFAILITFRYKKLLILSFVTAFIVAFLPINWNYYKERILLKYEENISALVYLDGWERAYLNLKESYGIGIGFNQLGYRGTEGGYFRDLLRHKDAGELNITDAGITAPKLISELGIFGIFLICIYIFFFIKNLIYIRSINSKYNKLENFDLKNLFFITVYISYFFELFVRGVGYFSITGFLLLASLWWFLSNHYKEYNKVKNLKG